MQEQAADKMIAESPRIRGYRIRDFVTTSPQRLYVYCSTLSVLQLRDKCNCGVARTPGAPTHTKKRGVHGAHNTTHPTHIFNSHKGWQRPTLPHPPRCSTIGAGRLSFRVRKGTGRDPTAITTNTTTRNNTQPNHNTSVLCETPNSRRE